jgi:hypothetical protein
MKKTILEAEEGLKADLVRVFCTFCLPFMLYYLYLDMQYSSYIKGSRLTTPLSYTDYLFSRMDDFKIIAFTALMGSVGVFFGPILARMRLNFRFGKQINTWTNTLKRTEMDTSLYLEFIQRVKQMSKIIADTMEHLEHSAENLSFESQQDLMMAIKELAEDLSKGLCGNLQKETLNLREMLNQTQSHFTDTIQNHNIQLKVTCPEELTVVADPLFMRVVLLNILGLPICSTQNNGEISVKVAQNNGYAHIEVEDSRYSLTNTGQRHLKFPHAFLAKNEELKQFCFQNDCGYEFRQQKGSTFYTKVSIPLEDYGALQNNVENLTAIH